MATSTSPRRKTAAPAKKATQTAKATKAAAAATAAAPPAEAAEAAPKSAAKAPVKTAAKSASKTAAKTAAKTASPRAAAKKASAKQASEKQVPAKKAAAGNPAASDAAVVAPAAGKPRQAAGKKAAARRSAATPVAGALEGAVEDTGAAAAKAITPRKSSARTPAPVPPVPAPVPAPVPEPAAAPVAAPAKARAPTPGKATAKKTQTKPATGKAAAPKAAAGKKRPAAKAGRPAAPVPSVSAQEEAAAPVAGAEDRPPVAAAGAAVPAPSPVPRPSGPAHSTLAVVEADGLRRLAWRPGHACPPALDAAVAERCDAEGHARADDDELLPLLLRRARDAGHALHIDAAAWPLWAADRDARRRLQVLEQAHAGGVGSPALQTLLHTTLPAFQAEGALFAVVAGRALIADERGLGKRVQAIAAATLWRRHFGLQRVLVLCTAAQRAAWQRQWQRHAGHTLAQPVQCIEGPLHQRAALWAAAAEVRVLSPEALETDAAHMARWAPELVIVDEPQQLAGWQQLQAPHALVLCGAPLAEAPALLEGIVEWLDLHRQGALHALRRIADARAQGLDLPEDELERLDAGLSRLMLQRLHAEVHEQLPPQAFSERLVPLAPAQREAHDRLRAGVQRLLQGWQRSGYLSDSDQWQLGRQLQALATACHRDDAGDATSPLTEASQAALQAQLDDWAATGTAAVAIAAAADDQPRLQSRLQFPGALHWLTPGAPVPDAVPVVLQVGVPWRPPHAGRGEGCRQWVCLVAQDSLELGLFETLALRRDTPQGAGQRDDRPFLAGRSRDEWLAALQAALASGDLPANSSGAAVG